MREMQMSGAGARALAVFAWGVMASVASAVPWAAPAAAQDADAAALRAQAGTARFGVWKMQSDAPPPQSNIMTYEPWGDGGMKITVASTNSRGSSSEWGYTTLFDGVFRAVEGQQGSETAVEVIDARSTRILNRRNGRVTQVVINTLSEDGNTISNEYVRLDAEGKIRGVSHAVYERVRGAGG